MLVAKPNCNQSIDVRKLLPLSLKARKKKKKNIKKYQPFTEEQYPQASTTNTMSIFVCI